MYHNESLKQGNMSCQRHKGYVGMDSRRYGELGLCIFFLALGLYKIIKDLPINDLLAMIWVYRGVENIYEYESLGTRKSLISAVCGIVAGIVFAILYVLQTW